MAYTKWQQSHWGFYLGGFRMRVIDGDYDFLDAVSLPYKNNKQNLERMQRVKEEHECDYDRCEYDCSGSSRVRIRISKRGGVLRMIYHKTLDV